MDILENGRGKVKLFLMFVHFSEVMWLFLITNSSVMWEEVFGGSKSKSEASTTAAIMTSLPILFTTWLIDNYLGTYLAMLVITLMYVVDDFIVIVMTIVLHLKHESIKELYPYIQLSFVFVYTSVTVNISSLMDLLVKDVRFYITMHRSLFVIASIVLVLIMKLKQLLTLFTFLQYFLFLFVIFFILTIVFFYLIIKFKHYFRLAPVKYGILNEMLCCSKYFVIKNVKGKSWTERALVEYPKTVVDEAAKFWAVAFLLSFTFIDSWSVILLKSSWKWQDAMMAQNAITDHISTTNLYNIMVFVFFFFWILVYNLLEKYIHITELQKIFISMVLTIPAILMTLCLHVMIRVTIGSVPTNGYGELRIINCHFDPIIIELYDPKHQVFAIEPTNYLSKRVPGIDFIPYRANYTIAGHKRDKILFAKEKQSTTYVSVNEFLVRLQQYDPINLEKKSIDANKAVIQLLSNEAGSLKIDNFYQLPEAGRSNVLFITPGNYSCTANFSNIGHNFSLPVERNGVYTLIIIQDKLRNRVLTKLHSILSPASRSIIHLHIPMILAALADSNEKIAVCVFVFLESPYSGRCTLIGLYFFYTSVAAFMDKIFSPPETYILINFLALYVVNSIVYLKLFLWWGLWNEAQAKTLSSINKNYF